MQTRMVHHLFFQLKSNAPICAVAIVQQGCSQQAAGPQKYRAPRDCLWLPVRQPGTPEGENLRACPTSYFCFSSLCFCSVPTCCGAWLPVRQPGTPERGNLRACPASY
eukprot:scaffold163365_cov20-Tisochrysis_lutea.AAC.2